MRKGLKLLNVFGLVLCLGSIFTYMVISALVQDSSLENLAFGRQIISAGTRTLTVPGMLVFILTSAWMGYVRFHGLKNRRYQLLLLLIALIIVNGCFFVAPLVSSVTEIATRSLAQGHLHPEYNAMFLNESRLGLANILLIAAVTVIGLW
jgi:hypothetical protein